MGLQGPHKVTCTCTELLGKNRTSAAKAVPAHYIYGTAKAVPFVETALKFRRPCGIGDLTQL
jgi:hypothetical protein